MNIVMLVGQHVGQIGILAAQACGHRIIAAVPYDEDCKKIVLRLGIQAFDSVKQLRFTDGARPVLLGPLGGDENQLGEVDALVSVHGREIIPPHILDHFNLNYGGMSILTWIHTRVPTLSVKHWLPLIGTLLGSTHMFWRLKWILAVCWSQSRRI